MSTRVDSEGDCQKEGNIMIVPDLPTWAPLPEVLDSLCQPAQSEGLRGACPSGTSKSGLSGGPARIEMPYVAWPKIS